MKKILSMLLVFAMMFGLIACGASKPAETQAPTEAPAPATTAPPTEAATEVPHPGRSCGGYLHSEGSRRQDAQHLHRYRRKSRGAFCGC